MTINFTKPGDVASQVYNEAQRSGESHEKAVEDAWNAKQHAKKNQRSSKNEENNGSGKNHI